MTLVIMDSLMTQLQATRVGQQSKRLTAVAESRGHTILDLAESWLLAHAVVGSVLTGATKPEQVDANVAAADWKLDADDMVAVAEALAPPA